MEQWLLEKCKYVTYHFSAINSIENKSIKSRRFLSFYLSFILNFFVIAKCKRIRPALVNLFSQLLILEKICEKVAWSKDF